MTVKHVWIALMLGAAVWGCEKNTSGTTNPQPAQAGLRYFDAVLDTGYMDFRIVDIVTFAPSAIRAQFRTGGNPYGVNNGAFSPPYLPVLAGSHHITVFKDSTDLATTQLVLYDTTMTFTKGWNYTFVLYGSARSASTIHSLILADSTISPPDANNSIWVRALNLTYDTTGIGSTADVFVLNKNATPAGAPTIGATAYTKPTAYVRVAADSLAGFIARAGTVATVAKANFQFGLPGTTSSNPVAGSLVKNTAFTVLVLPRSTPGAGVPTNYAGPGVFVLIDQQPPPTAN